MDASLFWDNLVAHSILPLIQPWSVLHNGYDIVQIRSFTIGTTLELIKQKYDFDHCHKNELIFPSPIARHAWASVITITSFPYKACQVGACTSVTSTIIIGLVTNLAQIRDWKHGDKWKRGQSRCVLGSKITQNYQVLVCHLSYILHCDCLRYNEIILAHICMFNGTKLDLFSFWHRYSALVLMMFH